MIGRRAPGSGKCSLLIVLLGTLAGCSVGPDFERPAAPDAKGYAREGAPAQTVKAEISGGEAQRFVQGMDIPAQWWTLFHSKPLNDLIEEALKNNADLAAAQAALKVARENYYAQQAVYYPSIDAGFNASRQKNSNTLSPTLAVPGIPYFNLYNSQVNVSYVLDVFGGNRRQVETLEAQADAQRFQVEATYLTLTSNVVAAAVQEASLRGQIAATEEIVKVESEQLDILRRRNALGDASGADVKAQEAALAQAEATLPPLRKQLALQRDLLTALAGRLPADEVAEKFDLGSLALPRDLPVSLPSKLVEQRPDIQAAEANLHAATAQVGVAIANMLPQITLNANIGSVATQANELFMPGNGFWQIAGGLTQPIFEGGSLLHKTRAARAALDQAAAQYRSTVITAFQNVADALRTSQHDADALKASAAAEQAASDSLAIARKQLQLGDISYSALLNAEQTYEQAVINRVQAQANRFADTAALFQALGGGWWNRAERQAQCFHCNRPGTS
ncbi:MAG TPA: efflux transporter outer membrane subunit [Alphaproteobacteria bacterium]|nr:efflux transporter outer membrane subunit [Alphaproteobacteria bacterium]